MKTDRRFLRRREPTKPKYVPREEYEEHLEQEAKARAKLNTRLRAIEIEYGLDLKPANLREVK